MRQLVLLIGMAFMLGGCSMSGLLFDDSQSCNEPGMSRFERLSCLTAEYSSLCEQGGIGVRDNLLRQRALMKGHEAVRMCRNKISVAIGPEIEGRNVTGSLAQQVQNQTSNCFHLLGKKRKICDARVKIDWLGKQFTAACASLRKNTFAAEDAMEEIVRLRDEVISESYVGDERIFATNARWMCRVKLQVAALSGPRIKTSMELVNDYFDKAVAKAQKTCGSDENASECVTGSSVGILSSQFRQACKGETRKEVQQIKLKRIVDARNRLLKANVKYARKRNFRWLCGGGKISVVSHTKPQKY